MNAKASKRKALEAQIVKTVNDVEGVPTLKKVFIFDQLNVHSEQTKVWGKEMNGMPYVIHGHELLLNEDKLIVKKRKGEQITGKLYSLDEELFLKTAEHYKGLQSLAATVGEEKITFYGVS